jgi:hypothetical protein
MEIILALGQDPAQACPRVLAHEIGHTLGLCHARVGLLSRMQGISPPGPGYVNDFSPIMTYYDVLALQILYTQHDTGRLTLQQSIQGPDPISSAGIVADGQPRPKPAFAPVAATPSPGGAGKHPE